MANVRSEEDSQSGEIMIALNIDG
ncbi:hypothetical protein NO004_530021 [Flavobacterium psychrophilum]|nr:hypothetical protein NO004_530021 [Flavobacterium psychrophilum]